MVRETTPGCKIKYWLSESSPETYPKSMVVLVGLFDCSFLYCVIWLTLLCCFDSSCPAQKTRVFGII